MGHGNISDKVTGFTPMNEHIPTAGHSGLWARCLACIYTYIGFLISSVMSGALVP